MSQLICEKNSKTFAKWYDVELTAENKKQFLIPEGFAHGFLVLSETAEFCYKANDFWHKDDEGGLPWNDPKIRIKWLGVVDNKLEDGTPLKLSEKDMKWRGLEDFRSKNELL